MRFGLKPLYAALDGVDFNDLPGTDDIPDPGHVRRPSTPAGTPSVGSGSAVGQAVLYSADNIGNAARSGGSGSGGSTIGTTSAATTSSKFVIDIVWDASVASAPAGFTAGVLAAVQYLESQFTDPVTMTIDIGYGEVDGYSLASTTLGESLAYLVNGSYSTIRNALAADATSPADAAAVASLPASDPAGSTVWLTTAQAKALDLISPNGTSLDGYAGFSSTLPFTYNDANGVAAGTYDFFGVAVHELTEIMGRMLLAGATVGGVANSYYLLDLFHYSSPGVRDFSPNVPGYFSIDGGATNLGTFNTTAGGDAGDWDASMGNNSFDAFSSSGVVNTVTQNDLTELDALGWNSVGTSQPPTDTSQPTGVNISPNTSGIAGAESSKGLAANAKLANILQVGGAKGDSYVYSIGGSGAGSFSVVDANNSATLTAGAAGVAGATSGRLYALTVNTTDATDGNSSPPAAFGMIVGSGKGDTINVAALSGALPSGTPEFVYGSAGNDTINDSGMTGIQWFFGGAGADTMTGGSGINAYMYGSVSDSTPTAMDVITNFHPSTDDFDLRGLGLALRSAGRISGSSLAADSVGWQASGGNTYVYVNASHASERLTATSMKIELAGTVQLSNNNIVHL